MNDFLQSLRNGQAEKPRTPKTRKNFDNSYHYTTQRFNSYGGGGYQNTRNQNVKRPPIPALQCRNGLPLDEASVTAMLADAIENLSNHIETLAKNQDYLINVQERMADMMERQAIAVERIVDHLNIAPGPDAEEFMEENEPVRTFEHHYVTPQKSEPDPIVPVEAPVVAATEPEKPIIRKRKKLVTAKAEEMVSTRSGLLSRDAVMDIISTMRSQGATFGQVATRLIELGQPTFSGRGKWHAQTIHRLCNKR
ncbi:MAG: hypothetical protein A3J85_00565 [Desulfobacula sp. RIFOXYA12_FULL_46_16]|nr:MAG: hypothetical protein A3J85_00565 [Desulfobacula sp. RIFOXYA12_FULL_46_16]